MDIIYSIYETKSKIIGFFQRVKYLVQHISFLWKTKSVVVWDYSFLLDLIVFRLEKLRECMEEDLSDLIKEAEGTEENYLPAIEDRQKRIDSISKCIEAYNKYVHAYDIVQEPDNVKDIVSIFDVEITREQEESLRNYYSEVDKLEKKNFKKFFKIMSDNIESWWV